MRLTRNKWWGKPGRFRRQMMVLYGRVQKEDAVLNMSVVIPINLTIAIVIVHLVIMWGLFDVGVIRNFILMLAGVWAFYGIIVAARRTKALEKQVHIQEQGQVAERLARAAEQLSSGVMSVRILAILSLEKIAIEAGEKICQDVVKVLCAYIREKCPDKGQDKAPFFSDESPMPRDIRTILNVLVDIKNKTSWRIKIDLSNINLSGVSLMRADLSGVSLRRANLSGASLWVANLSGASLQVANLSGASLWRADLSGANLSIADLSGADLSNVNLRRANLSGADLSGANLMGADLSEVKGLGTAQQNLETVNNPPPEILAVIEMQKQIRQSGEEQDEEEKTDFRRKLRAQKWEEWD